MMDRQTDRQTNIAFMLTGISINFEVTNYYYYYHHHHHHTTNLLVTYSSTYS